jgi:hypothetical protein
MARQEFQRTFYVLRDERVVDVLLDLPWLDDEQASLYFVTTRIFTSMDGTSLETKIEDRRLECLLMSSGKAQKLMCKTCRSKGRNADFYMIRVSPTAEHPPEFHTREELTSEQREHLR